jgi:hypothetical protein
MKRLSVLAIALLTGAFILNSCEDMDVNVETSFKKQITVDVEETGKQVNSDSYFPFSETDILDISDNEAVEENIDSFKDLEVRSVTCKLTGIPDGESISELTITIPEALISVTLTNINENNNAITLDISNDLLNALENFLFENHSITIQVNGGSTYAPMQLGVELEFAATIITSI